MTAGLVDALRVHSRTVRHEPGRIVRDLAVTLADGGDRLTDLGALRDQEVLFGPVASDTTAQRCIERLDEAALTRVCEARAASREATAEPKTLRYRLFHVAGRIRAGSRQLKLRLQRGREWGPAMIGAFARLRSLPTG
ncbi:MAG: hypothetical protein ACYC6J_05255 [Coriobacteriia bacterium]